MIVGTKVACALERREDLDACFDVTCEDVFATACHLVAGDRGRAEQLMIDVYLTLHRAVGEGSTVDVDHDWIVATALRQVLGHEPDGANEALTALERAVLELHLVDGRDIDTVSAMLGLTSAEVTTSLARYEDHSAFGTGFGSGFVADLLRRSELWLDDATRRRARAALRRGERPLRRYSSAGAEPPGGSPDTEPSQQAAPPPTRPSESLPRPNRTTIAVVSAVFAVVAVGVVWIVPRHDTGSSATVLVAPIRATLPDEPSEAGPESAVTVATDAPPKPVRTPVAAPGFVLGDVPPGFRPQGASEEVLSSAVGQFELWAEPGASRTSGRWLALSTMAYAASSSAIVAGGSRELIGDSPAVMVTAPDGVSAFTVQPVAGGQFSLTGSGFSDDELRRLAAGITLRGGEPAFDVSLDPLRSGLEPLVRQPSEYAERSGLRPGGWPLSQITRGQRRWTTYLSDDQSQSITVTTRSTTPNDVLTTELLLPSANDPLAPAVPGRTMQMGDLVLSISGAPGDGGATPPVSIIQWHDEGDETVTISGNVGLDVLFGAIPSVRRATADEWMARFQIRAVDLSIAVPQPLGGELVRIGRTTTADASRWTIFMSDDPVGVRIDVRNNSVAGSVSQAEFEANPLTPVQEYVSISATVIVVAVQDPGDATGVRISVAGSNPITTPLVPVEGAGLYAVGYGFSQVAPYTVELVDRAGVTVRALHR